MSRIHTASLPGGIRAASTCVDLDGVQVLVTLYNVHGEVSADVAFRSHPGQPWSEAITLDKKGQRPAAEAPHPRV